MANARNHNALQEIEREEGEIVESLDYLSDISSEEEFLLRQRLQVLENYNNVLERKKAKRSSIGSGNLLKKPPLLLDLSDISASETEENYCTPQSHFAKEPKQKAKSRRRLKKHKENSSNVLPRTKYHKKCHVSKKKKGAKVVLESSDESDDEYKFKRRKLADAVVVHKETNEKSSLSSRLKEMLQKAVNREPLKTSLDDKKVESSNNKIMTYDLSSPISPSTEGHVSCFEIGDSVITKTKCSLYHKPEVIEASVEDEVSTQDINQNSKSKNNFELSKDRNIDIVDSVDCIRKSFEREEHLQKDSDDDLETLRQTALNTKATKSSRDTSEGPAINENKTLSDDEDSDTAELRLICLKSTLLKKAIEMKQKQKRQKKLSQSSHKRDELIDSLYDDLNNRDSGNNTDKESVDMEIGSDETTESRKKTQKRCQELEIISNQNFDILPPQNVPKQDEFDEDEDLLRAKLLTSLSKNLPNLVDAELINDSNGKASASNSKINAESIPEEKKFIIKLGESDSEAENEATKNLTKMHMKLSEDVCFATKLDNLLKSTRMQVEKNKHSETETNSPVTKKPEKFVAKALNNLPKSEQIEYRNLVKRMAELEKMKESRQSAMNHTNTVLSSDTLKPKNVPFNAKRIVTISSLEEQIANSRKKIAEESSKMLKLKEEAVKLSQKYKIAATELRNISTAIYINKKHQRAIQNSLTKIRSDHQLLIKSSSKQPVLNKHSKINRIVDKKINKITIPNHPQKENDPLKIDHKNTVSIKNTKSIKEHKESLSAPTPMLSIEIDVGSKRKVVKLPPKNPVKLTPTSTDNLPPISPVKPRSNSPVLLSPKSPVNESIPEIVRGRSIEKKDHNINRNDDSTQSSGDCELGGNTVAEREPKLPRSEKYERLLGEYISPLESLGTSTSSETYVNENSRPMPIQCFYFGFYKTNVDSNMRTHRRSPQRFGGPIRTRSSVLSRSAEIARTPNANSYTSTSSHNDTTHTQSTGRDTIEFIRIIHITFQSLIPFPTTENGSYL
ncbi:putative leucine-rich repeat-containing protein DDB_G0290503 isoform X2 [Bombyx mori]|uniref:Uncharacterized protein n=1 Tax=Bombyx mori TaxID=7091 RepID=A0A8R2HQM0_BOMMO|nr:putative leucine-rich repeat-containing protein DDB_G0290503 isoform X2 [Bombyx mori]